MKEKGGEKEDDNEEKDNDDDKQGDHREIENKNQDNFKTFQDS